jgi:hypothetical protein
MSTEKTPILKGNAHLGETNGAQSVIQQDDQWDFTAC